MQDIKSKYPTSESVLAAPIVDLSANVLAHLVRRLQRPQDAECCGNFLGSAGSAYGQDLSVLLAFSEAWEWLRCNGFICHHPSHGDNWVTVTRKARDVILDSGFDKWVSDRELPAELLHPSLQGNSLNFYRQGLYDTAVFEAFKTLEVSIRNASGLGNELVGTKLAGRAFNPESGELTDQDAEAGERQALMNLMCGALGRYKNPQSHRHVGVEASEARDMLVMASHLIQIVLSRAK